ncbi:MAG TPA: hypothetical protein VD978_07980 [Azospirillum sp.]|nr:hypothetical protein [Azospirillum sp.]
MPKPPVFALLLLASCGPVYETAYHFVPPDSAEGQRCTAQCQAEHATCTQSCERRERLCLSDADSRAMRDYQIDLGDAPTRRRSPATSRTYFDYADRYRAICYAGGCRDQCDATHRACFESCGGKVSALQVCTANCGS